MKNIFNRFVPAGFTPYRGSIDRNNLRPRLKRRPAVNMGDKLIDSVSDIFDRLKISDGMTLSFHHHLRAGDRVMNIIMREIKRRNLKNLTLAPSSLFPNHELLSELIIAGCVSKIYTDYLNGPFASVIGAGKMNDLLIMDTH